MERTMNAHTNKGRNFVNCQKWCSSCPLHVPKNALRMMILILFIFVRNKNDIVCAARFHYVRYQFMIESYFHVGRSATPHNFEKRTSIKCMQAKVMKNNKRHRPKKLFKNFSVSQKLLSHTIR